MYRVLSLFLLFSSFYCQQISGTFSDYLKYTATLALIPSSYWLYKTIHPKAQRALVSYQRKINNVIPLKDKNGNELEINRELLKYSDRLCNLQHQEAISLPEPFEELIELRKLLTSCQSPEETDLKTNLDRSSNVIANYQLSNLKAICAREIAQHQIKKELEEVKEKFFSRPFENQTLFENIISKNTFYEDILLPILLEQEKPVFSFIPQEQRTKLTLKQALLLMLLEEINIEKKNYHRSSYPLFKHKYIVNSALQLPKRVLEKVRSHYGSLLYSMDNCFYLRCADTLER